MIFHCNVNISAEHGHDAHQMIHSFINQHLSSISTISIRACGCTYIIVIVIIIISYHTLMGTSI